MNSGALKEILKVEFLSFTKEEIENIMDEELEKSPEEMDTELIEMCLDILTGKPKEKADEVLTDSPAVSDKTVKKIKFKKGILVAAIIALFITVSVPVGAKIFDINVPESILKIYEEYFQLNLDGETQSEDLDTILACYDLDSLILPRFLFLDCKISEFEKVIDEHKTQISFKYVSKEQKMSGDVILNIFKQNMNFLDREMKVNDQYEEAKRITVNGINVIVFKKGREVYILYSVTGTEYNIMLYGVTIDEAVEIASTL